MDLQKTERQADLSSIASRPHATFVAKLHKRLLAEVTNIHADVLLLICCLISGLVDSSIYHAYGTFVSMQTVHKFRFLSIGT